MSKLRTILLAATAAGTLTTVATAAPMSVPGPQATNLVQQVRTVCDQWGRCFETRRHYRDYDGDEAHIYVGPRHYRHYDEPRAGVTFGFVGPRRGW